MRYSDWEIERIIERYRQADVINEYTDMCESIIKKYEQNHSLTDRQIKCLIKQSKDGVNSTIKYSTEQIKNAKAQGVIYLNRLPRNCDECPLTITEYDEDAMWGSGYSSSCMFGCSIWGSAIERPSDCPLKQI